MAYHRSSAFLVLFLACMGLGLSLAAATRESFTCYWTPSESGICRGKAADTGIQDCNTKQEIAKVCGDFWNKIHTEGAGKLKDGRYVTCQDNNCYCFGVTDGPKGSKDNNLHLYVSIAVPGQKYPFGTKLEISQLKGLVLPGGGRHNGCVRVEDSCTSCNMDFYVGLKRNYDAIDAQVTGAWDVTSGSNCEIWNYGN
ncbi:hypothetical protein SELMODRAFT_405120 [Selaginella moellendorffii]|uniref:Uncharacterized protein n=1 Tax=Selaginella moellendorffii TaxID=88036 RepID=D8QYG5_SELML|nr:hypothetical protein SELMODRAFT_405120 [Selaginella moellendorffii]